MFDARIRFLSLWVSQVARVLADWGLRITAFMQARESAILGPLGHEFAWYVVTAVYITPFILLAPFHGFISNSLPRRWVMVVSSLFCFAAVALLMPLDPTWLGTLGALALGSALYSPARYAVLPAAARDTGWPLTTVNGLIELGFATAIVGGIMLGLGGFGDVFPGLPWNIAIFIGLNALSVITAVPAHFRSDVLRPEPVLAGVRGFFRDCRRIFADRTARGTLLGLAFYQALVVAGSGATITTVLGVGQVDTTTRTAAMLSLTWLTVGLALGCALASLQGNPRRALGLVPMGITGLFIGQIWSSMTSEAGVAPAAASFVMGLTGGLVNVPLRSAYQTSVPRDAHGNAMSVMNAVCYLVTTLVAVFVYGLIQVRILPTSEVQMWFVVGAIALFAVVCWRQLWIHALEQFLEWLLLPIYRIHPHGPGRGKVPQSGPLLVVANHTSYVDPFWVGKVLPRSFTPMMMSKFFDKPFIRWLMVNVIGAIRVEMSKFRREAPELREAVEVLRRGGCVLMFPEGILRRKEELILRQFGQGVWHILREVPDTPVQVLWVEGGWGSYLSYKNGPPGKGKRMDFWRRIDVALPEVERLDAEVLVDHRTTRRYLMRKCLEARRILGLDVPEGPIPGLAEFTEEEQPDEVA